MHIKAYTETPNQYPERFPLAQNEVEWSKKCEGYAPIDFTSKVVLNQFAQSGQNGWADPDDVSMLAREIISLISELTFDENNRPINPMGRTGIAGRGLLGKWGPNFAGDPIVTRTNAATNKVDLLVIQRKDCLQWALPGGMVDKDEAPLETISRELKEETNVDLKFTDKDIVYQGYVDDMRNTDNAWMETTGAHKHIDYKESLTFELSANDDAQDVRWEEINDELFDKLFASHSKIVKFAVAGLILKMLNESISKVVSKIKP